LNAADVTQIDPFWYSRIQDGQNYISRYWGGWIVVGDSLANNYGNWLDYGQFSLTHLVDLGVGGDAVENVMWRWPNYDFSAWTPSVVVVIAGTNNINTAEAAEDIVNQIEALACTINATLPHTQIVLFSLLPRGYRFSDHPDEIAQINAALQQDSDSNLFPFVLVDPGPWIHSQCDPQFAADPNLLMCSLYKDFTHVQSWVYDYFTPMVQAALSLPTADISVAVSPASPAVKHHGMETFTVVINNAGPSAATSLEIVHTMSKGATFVSVTSSAGSCQTPAVGTWGLVTCGGFDLGSGATVTETLTMYVTGPDGAVVSDTAAFLSPVHDLNSANRIATGMAAIAN
jgi:uncharacterized repeat protein (TIGR01451 family)